MHSNKDLISKYHFILAILLIMAVFAPVNYFSFLNFDDNEVIERAHRSFSDINWRSLFLKSSTTVYYRPLIDIMNYMDYALWGLSMGAWHLTNYIVHIFNACLVYLIAGHFWREKPNAKYWAVAAMLLFALHPMTCESVAWIAGRSDLAGTFFALLAVYFYFKKSYFRFILTPVAILAGLLCKENALAIIPIIVVLDLFLNYKKRKTTRKKIKSFVLWSSIVIIPLAIYLFLRTNGWEHYTYKYVDVANNAARINAGNINSLNKVISDKIDFFHILYILPVISFYLKKLIIPFPLNFAITQINTLLYSILFAIFIGTAILCVIKKHIPVLFLMVAVVLSFVPALPIALGGVSWVPMAERYLYLSLSITAIGLVSIMMYCYEKGLLNLKLIMGLSFLVILILAGSTFNRVFVFKDDKTLWTKTYETNPENGMVLLKYAQAARGEEGQQAYRKALSIPSFVTWRAEALLGIAQYEISNGKAQDAAEKIEEALRIKNDRQINMFAASLLLSIDEKNEYKKRLYVKKALECYERAYKKNKPVVVKYKLASLLKSIDHQEEAEKLFVEIINKHPNTKYAGYARKHLEN